MRQRSQAPAFAPPRFPAEWDAMADEPVEAGIWILEWPGREASAPLRLSAGRLFELLQTAAAGHAEALGVGGDALRGQRLAWVLLQWSLEMSSWPDAGEAVRIETWPSGYTDRIVRRDFFVCSAGGTRIGRATSHWAMLDLDRRRPVRMPASVRGIPTPVRDGALDAALAKFPAPDPPASLRTFRVSAEHLDANGHVNNVRFVEWVLASLPDEAAAGPLAAIDLAFRAEARDGETLTVACGPDPSPPPGRLAFRHRIAADGRELLLGRSALRSRFKPL